MKAKTSRTARGLPDLFFVGGTNSLSQNLTVLPAPSGREPLAYPQTLHFCRKLYRYAKGPILEDDFPRPGEDVVQRQKGESVAAIAATGGVQFVSYSTASEMSLPSSSTSTTSIMGRMKRAPFFRAKCEPSRLPRMLLMAQGMPMWNTTRPFIR